ncbi:MAG: C40 family peptidase, partial [Mycobacterium sp.]|nr:C40 family peptidase [Mycobacterium sp.]
MRHNDFRRIRWVWLLSAVIGLLLGLASPAAADDGPWDPTLPIGPSAGAPGDPVAIANASLNATAQATQTTMDMGRQFLGSLGINLGGNSSPNGIPRVYGRQAVEYVIRRGSSQMGVPYSWGGGTLQGPSRGVGSGADTVGFDCSGLTRFSFAGVGVLIPRYSGDQ